jgi:cation diffusion facilitator family transporter
MTSYSGEHVHRPGEPHGHESHEGHTHGAIDPSLFRSERGIWAVKWSLVALLATAVFQLFIVAMTGSVALLADTIHNFGDALTAIPLWIAFRLGQRPATKHYTYGLGRVEDLAGLLILLAILVSAVLAGREAILRFLNPQPIENLWAVILAALVGFAGNEAVAYFRIKVGREIGSQALVADGYHARTDGLSSLAVLVGAVGVALGFPMADPLAALLITLAILKILWDSAGPIFNRLLDGVDPEVVDEIAHAASHVPGVQAVSEVRVRWLGHRMLTELNIAVEPYLSVTEGHELARQVHHELLHDLTYLWAVTIHVDPAYALGSHHHGYLDHNHDNLPVHSHFP